jgi:hypothetical protein
MKLRQILFVMLFVFALALCVPKGTGAQRVQWTKTGWQIRLTRHEMLIARGDKARDYVYSRKNLRTGRERPIVELNKWFLNWNHHFISFSPDGRWAAWRDTDENLIAASLDGRMKRLIWNDRGDFNNPIVWLPGSRRFIVLQEFSEDPKGSDTWRPRVREIFDVRSPGKSKIREVSKEEAARLLKLPRRSPFA